MVGIRLLCYWWTAKHVLIRLLDQPSCIMWQWPVVYNPNTALISHQHRSSKSFSLSLSLRRFFLPSPPPHSIRSSPVKTEEIQPCWKHLPHPLLLYHPHYHKRHQFSEKRGTKYNWCCCGVGGVTVSLKGIIWHRVVLLFFFYIEGGLLGWTSDSLLDICWENWIYWNYYYWEKKWYWWYMKWFMWDNAIGYNRCNMAWNQKCHDNSSLWFDSDNCY